MILINYTGRNGGGPIDAYEMAKGFLENGEKVVAIISKHVSNRAKWEKLPLECLILIDTICSFKEAPYKYLKFKIQGKRKIKKKLQAYKFDFIYCPMVAIYTKEINELFHNTAVCVVNHDPIPHSGDKGLILLNMSGMQKIYTYADVVVTHSRCFISYIEKKYHKEKRTLYVPLGLHNIEESVTKQISYSDVKTNFLFFGRIEEYKGLDILAEAYRLLRKKTDKVALYIVGAGDFSPYQQLYNELQEVHLHNRWIDDKEIGEFFSGENLVLVLPYKDSTQSGPVLIAMQFGIPVIGTRTGGLQEQIIHEHTGMLVEPNNARDLCNAMYRMTIDKELRIRCTSGIKEYLEKNSWGRSAEKIIEFMGHLKQDVLE